MDENVVDNDAIGMMRFCFCVCFLFDVAFYVYILVVILNNNAI